MRTHCGPLSQMLFHLHVRLVVNSVEILFEVMLEVFFFHFLLEFIVEGVGFLVGRVWFLGELET